LQNVVRNDAAVSTTLASHTSGPTLRLPSHDWITYKSNSTVTLAQDPAPAAPFGSRPQPAQLRGKRIVLAPGRRAGLRSRLPARTALALGLEVDVPEDMAAGDELLIHVVQRWDGGGVAGGLSLLLRARKEA